MFRDSLSKIQEVKIGRLPTKQPGSPTFQFFPKFCSLRTSESEWEVYSVFDFHKEKKMNMYVFLQGLRYLLHSSKGGGQSELFTIAKKELNLPGEAKYSKIIRNPGVLIAVACLTLHCMTGHIRALYKEWFIYTNELFFSGRDQLGCQFTGTLNNNLCYNIRSSTQKCKDTSKNLS